MKKVKVGVVGAGDRGFIMTRTIAEDIDNAQVVAVCDIDEQRANKTADMVFDRTGEKPWVTADYKKIIEDEQIEAVLVMTGWEMHIKVATAAMRAGKYAAIEVGGANSIEECWELVKTYEETGVPCMMLENCCYGKTELGVLKMVREGFLGEIVHCDGKYGHDVRYQIIKEGVKENHYRYNEYKYKNCENYPTHELGPIAKILKINRGNAMISLTSTASKQIGIRHYIDKYCSDYEQLKGETFKQGDVVTTVIRCANGETIRLTLDTTLPRFYSRGLGVHGTRGLYTEDNHSIFHEDIHIDHTAEDESQPVDKYLPKENYGEWRDCWGNADEYIEKYMPYVWDKYGEKATSSGHGGMDYMVLSAFFESVIKKTQTPIDVYDAAAWMAITTLSEKSIANGCAPMEIPDFTCGKWKDYKKPEEELEFTLD